MKSCFFKSLLILSICLYGFSGIAFPTIHSSSIGFKEESKVPEYYPGDGVHVVLKKNEKFVFVWPEKWSSDSVVSFKLVRIEKGQKAKDAIKDNIPVYQNDSVTCYYLEYPQESMPLLMGDYAWQLKDCHGNTLLQTRFTIDTISSSKYDVIIHENIWMYLKEKLDGSYQVSYDKSLMIHYYEPYTISSTQRLRFCIYDKHRNVVLKTDDSGTMINYSYAIQSPLIQTGDNWITIPLGNNCQYNQIYYLETWDAKGDRLFLRFKCVSNKIDLGPNNSETEEYE